MPQTVRQSWFAPIMGLLFVYAWITLWLWELSPYGRYLHHGQWTELGLAGDLCTVPRIGGTLAPALLYVGGWVLMTTAMMLPTTMPLLEAYRRLTQRRADRWLLMGLVATGYLFVWSLFGIAAHGAGWLLHELVLESAWLTFNGWIVGAVIFLIAGLFQFSPLKYRCLDKCRAPLSFVMRHWKGHAVRRHALLLGLDHGAYCVGCCWALMLLMFVLGTGSVGWMLLLGALMAAEKNLPFGRRFAAPLGGALLAGAAAIVVSHLGDISAWAA
jgi:predicted metal-binding membrane protein